jgi:signal transduction histidine kinase
VVEFDYTAASLAAPERVQFRHRLAGHDRDWVEAGPRRVAFYTNLRPGRYVFEVLAANNHGVWAVAPARFAFAVAPAFHQTAWFPPAVAAVLAGAALGAHRLRVRLVRRRLALEAALRLARERERIARDMHDDVGASLTQIALLAERARRSGGAESRPLLGRIAEAARETAQAMDEIVWAVNPRNDRLEHLANYVCQFAREYLEPTGIRCRLDVPALLPDLPVPSDRRHHLLMALKESLGNAAQHSGATEVTVELRFAGRELCLAVADNGRGFAAEAPAPARAGGGNGLAHLRRRAEALGGRCEIRSAPGAGTRVEMTLRLTGEPTTHEP